MKNKRFLSAKMKEVFRRIRPRTLVCCVLITVLLVSASIGMGYSKFMFQTEPYQVTYQIKNYALSDDSYVVLPKVENPPVSYNFVSPDRNVKVAYSKQSTDDTLNNAEYLISYFEPEINTVSYTSHSNQIDLRYEIGLTCVNRTRPLQQVGLKCSINGSPRGIVVYMNVGTDADPTTINSNTISVRYTYPETFSYSNEGISSVGQIIIGSFGQLYRISTEDELLNSRFEVQYDKYGWSHYADTAWYTDDPDDDEYWITTPQQLAGLAQLVNNGTETFEDKTIYLDEDISLADANGYLRKWTPIGTQTNPFMGSFDGGSHTISGLNIADFGASGTYASAGLFGYIDGNASGAEIKDLTIRSSYLSAYLYDDPTAAVPESNGAAGALAGWVNGGYLIDNVSIEGFNLCGIATCGGFLIGRCDADTIFTNCTADTDCTSALGGYSALNTVDDLVGFQTAP